ncbi:hypothetical protein SLEP1_g50464 [Rubroshorea leprosula]|uniref:Uncharacterized protein n=1 Tax=Rubroshorea leprosula TaxID=152421 RepID=A0AAV5M027_9ROSI|nr:hypothetical protein SLEP1_g50464 [Rubroshorea leprosula]
MPQLVQPSTILNDHVSLASQGEEQVVISEIMQLPYVVEEECVGEDDDEEEEFDGMETSEKERLGFEEPTLGFFEGTQARVRGNPAPGFEGTQRLGSREPSAWVRGNPAPGFEEPKRGFEESSRLGFFKPTPRFESKPGFEEPSRLGFFESAPGFFEGTQALERKRKEKGNEELGLKDPSPGFDNPRLWLLTQLQQEQPTVTQPPLDNDQYTGDDATMEEDTEERNLEAELDVEFAVLDPELDAH